MACSWDRLPHVKNQVRKDLVQIANHAIYDVIIGNKLQVQIVANYTSPSSLSLKPPSYLAGSPLSLSCVVKGSEGDNSNFLFEWRSTCEGDCFVRSGIAQTVSTPYLHSRDQGTHTCVVHDFESCSGSANITVQVTGKYLLLFLMVKSAAKFTLEGVPSS